MTLHSLTGDLSVFMDKTTRSTPEAGKRILAPARGAQLASWSNIEEGYNR